MPADVKGLEVALASLHALLETDGYALRLERADGEGVVLRIDAGPDACADCLVPPSIMQLYVRDALSGLPDWQDAPIIFHYPGHSAETGA